MHVILKTVDV